MFQLQPMENEDETDSYERVRESCTTRLRWSVRKRRKHVLKFFCHTKASIYLPAGKVGLEVTERDDSLEIMQKRIKQVYITLISSNKVVRQETCFSFSALLYRGDRICCALYQSQIDHAFQYFPLSIGDKSLLSQPRLSWIWMWQDVSDAQTSSLFIHSSISILLLLYFWYLDSKSMRSFVVCSASISESLDW